MCSIIHTFLITTIISFTIEARASVPVHGESNLLHSKYFTGTKNDVGDLLTIRSTESGTGGHLDPCRSTADCIAPRVCLDYYEAFVNYEYVECTPASPNCACNNLVPLLAVCQNSAKCAYGERCVAREQDQLCVSCEFMRRNPDQARAIDEGNCVVSQSVAPTPSPTPTPRPRGTRLTNEACTEQADCRPPRRCLQNARYFKKDDCTPDSLSCLCRSLSKSHSTCKSSSTCLPGDRCVVNLKDQTLCMSCRIVAAYIEDPNSFRFVDDGNCDADGAREPLPVQPIPMTSEEPLPSPDSSILASGTSSPPISPSPSRSMPSISSPSMSSIPSSSISPFPSSSISPTPPPSPTQAVCISTTHLSNLSPNELVFRRSVVASVLCDTHGSCATPAHIVTFHARPMTMTSYCEQYAACTKHDMAVNSPKMRRGVRVSAPTVGLEFTALSAAYMTRIEEIFMQILVRSGIA